MVLDDTEHICGTNTRAEEDTRGAVRTSRKNNAALRSEGDETIGTDVVVVCLNSGDLGTIANKVQDIGVVLVCEVGTGNSGLEVSVNRASALATLEVV